MRPFFGIRMTATLHVPSLNPRTDEPTNPHALAPDTMLRRSLPCDPRGMATPTAAANRAAVRLRPRRTVRTDDLEVVAAAVALVVVDVNSVVVVLVDDDASVETGDVTGVVPGTVVAGRVVAGASVVVVVVVVVVAGRPATTVGVARFVRSAWPV